MNKLLTALPPRYETSGQITLLLQALAQELERLEQAVQTAAARRLIAQADEAGLVRWENDLELSHRPDLTLEGRKAILLAAMDCAYHGTAAALQTYAQALTGSPEVQVQQDYGAYTLTLTAGANSLVDFYSLQHWVRKRLPVHITLQLIHSDTAKAGDTVENG